MSQERDYGDEDPQSAAREAWPYSEMSVESGVMLNAFVRSRLDRKPLTSLVYENVPTFRPRKPAYQ